MPGTSGRGRGWPRSKVVGPPADADGPRRGYFRIMGARRAPEDTAPGDELFERVSEVVLAVTSQLSVRDVLQTIVRSARSLAGARYAALGVPDGGGSFAEFVVDGISARRQAEIGP